MPFLSLKFAVGLLIAGLLGATHFASYRTGRALVAAEWAQAREVQAQQALVANEAARAQEQILVGKVSDVGVLYVNEKKRRVIDASAAAGELRELQGALDDAGDRAARATATAARTHAATVNRLLAACAGEYQAMAAKADDTAGRLIGLQSYVQKVCK
jgi:hypothetical protein